MPEKMLEHGRGLTQGLPMPFSLTPPSQHSGEFSSFLWFRNRSHARAILSLLITSEDQYSPTAVEIVYTMKLLKFKILHRPLPKTWEKPWQLIHEVCLNYISQRELTNRMSFRLHKTLVHPYVTESGHERIKHPPLTPSRCN